jgi:hypothetical protein
MKAGPKKKLSTTDMLGKDGPPVVVEPDVGPLPAKANATGMLSAPNTRAQYQATREKRMIGQSASLEEVMLNRQNKFTLGKLPPPSVESIGDTLPPELSLHRHGPGSSFRKPRRPHATKKGTQALQEEWLTHIENTGNSAAQFYATFGIDNTGGGLVGDGPDGLTSIDVPAWSLDQKDMQVRQMEEQCDDIADHMRQVERTVAIAVEEARNLEQKTKKLGGGGGMGGEEQPLTSEQMGAEYHNAVHSMGSTLSQLDNLFGCRESFNVLSNKKAVVINTAARRYLAKKKYKRARIALVDWHKRNEGGLLILAKMFMKRQITISNGMAVMEAARNMRMLTSHFAGWADVTRDNIPNVKAGKAMAEAAATAHIMALRSRAFRSWAKQANGPHARKVVTANYEGRLAAALDRLEKSGKYKVVTRELIQREMNRDAAQRIRKNERKFSKARHFRLWSTEGLMQYRQNLAKANAHFARVTQLNVLGAWVVITRKRGDPTDGGRYQATRHERFVQAHNNRMVHQHFRLKCLRKHLHSWRVFHTTQVAVSKKFQHIIDDLAQRTLHALHKAAKQQRQVKRLCVGQWKEYALRLLLVPFRAWYIYASERRARHKAQNALVFAYHNRQNRILKYNVFKMWRHQAIYGKVEGIHTRLELMKTVEEQRRHCLALEESVSKSQDNIEELEKMLELEETKNKQKSEALTTKEAELTRLKFALHQAEQEMVAGQGVLDAVGRIHSGTVRRILEESQIERQLTPVVQKVAERRRSQAEKEKEDQEREKGVLGAEAAGAEGAASAAGEGAAVAGALPAGMHAISEEDKQILDRAKHLLTLVDFSKVASLVDLDAESDEKEDAEAVAGAAEDNSATSPVSSRRMLRKSSSAMLPDDTPSEPATADTPFGTISTEKEAEGDPASHFEGLSFGTEAHQLYSCIEFMRTGETRPLVPQNKPGYDAEAAAAEEKAAEEEAAAAAAAAAEDAEEAEGGEGGKRKKKKREKKIKEPEPPIQRMDVVEQTKNWNDFVQGLIARCPPRRNVPVRDRLAKRIAAAKEEGKHKLERFHEEPYNMYSSSKRNLTEDIAPPQQEPWQMDKPKDPADEKSGEEDGEGGGEGEGDEAVDLGPD